MKDLGHLRYFLGLEVAYGPRGYLLSQQKYIYNLLARAELTNDQIADTPLQLHQKLAPDIGKLLENPTRYREIVGALVYLTISRLDIAYVVHVVSQFVQSPTTVHYVVVLSILHYLRGTLSRALLFSSTSKLQRRAFSDSDWADDIIDCRSINGFCVFLGDTIISWRAKKQHVVSKSSTEVEYRAMSTATSEIIWLRQLLCDMTIDCLSPTPLYYDSQSTIKIATNVVFHEHTKHIEIDSHFIRHHYSKTKAIFLSYISSELQLADFFIKVHTSKRHKFLLS
ncbi:uncharacterized protein LOC109826854 [Asparagus officinalis]|uniref:uncharacterized protein LOC109826854 n=1 Tax=Asparagus officinalis TaxID=4686 RepID=UPI00098E58E8|nr:uncharacterized protein LOC109826854 [Asparagus officinalis]